MRSIVRALAAARQLTRFTREHPLDYARYTRFQEAVLRSRAKRKLIRTGNRAGKSKVAIDDLILRAECRHPWRPDWNERPGPVHQWLVTVSWSQSVPLQKMLREALPTYVKQPNWDPGKGWGKDAPTLVWPDGSTIGIRTMRQGPLAHAGAELDHILIDEPCAIEHFRELERRVISRAGEVTIAMTPINAPGDLQWLQDLVIEGVIEDLHYPMNEDLFRYADDGSLRTLPDGTICDQAWIDEQSKAVPRRFRDIVLHGAWDEVITDSEFAESWDRAKHVSAEMPEAEEKHLRYALGIDHGTQSFTETAVLVCVDESTEYPTVYVLDCWEGDGNAGSSADAAAVLAMLRRNGLAWRDLHFVMGDIPHYGGRGKIARKSNAEMSYELAKHMRLPKGAPLSPQIRTAKSGKGSGPKGSVNMGLGWLHRSLVRPGQFKVHPDANRIGECFEKYRGGSTDPHGHLIDALRYALDPWIRRGQSRSAKSGRVQIRVA